MAHPSRSITRALAAVACLSVPITAAPPAGAAAAGTTAGTAAAAPSASGAATTPTRATSPASSDTGWRYLRARRGGTVYGPDNVSITVPRGVMKRNGRVSVQEIYPGVYNIHIAAKWRGRVKVRLPLHGDIPVVAHKRNGRWILERARIRDGQAVARVRSLSLFSALRECAPKLIGGSTKGSVASVLKCFARHGVKKLPQFIAKKIAGFFNEWDPCLPPGWDNWSVDALEILFTSCPAGEGDPPPPAPTPNPPPKPPAPKPVADPPPAPKAPAPAPAAPPKPAPAPQPAAARTIVVNTCNTYGNCDYWNPIWVHSNPAGSSRIADVSRGTTLTARCWAAGRQLTDGSNNTAEDDARQFTSSLWYGVDWAGGRGYVPAVWTTKAEDHLGLPRC